MSATVAGPDRPGSVAPIVLHCIADRLPRQAQCLPKVIVKKILYVDMDNVLVDFPSGIAQLHPSTIAAFEGRLDEVPGIFASML